MEIIATLYSKRFVYFTFIFQHNEEIQKYKRQRLA